MFKLTVVCVILALAVMSEGYVKSNRGHDADGDDRLRVGGGSQYPRPQEGLGGGNGQHGHSGGSQYPRPQEGLGGGQFHQGQGGFGSGSQGQGGFGGGHQHGNQYGHDQGGYKRHGY